MLVIGGGRVARALARARWPSDLQPLYRDRKALELTTADLDRAVEEAGADAVINTAAWTDVDGAEKHKAEAWAVNAEAPARLADATRRRGASLVHLSTDYVFGHGAGPWDEDADCAPLNVYGETKRAGELEVLKRDWDALVVRTAWLFDGASANFLTAMLGMKSRETLDVISDQTGSPTFTDDLADGLLALLSQQLARREGGATEPRGGVLHFANSGDGATRLQLAQAVFEAALKPEETGPILRPVLSQSWLAAAQRPSDSRLCTRRWSQRGLPRPRPWTDAVCAAVAQARQLDPEVAP